MKKETPAAVIIGAIIVVLLVVGGYGYYVMKPSQVLRDGVGPGTEAPQPTTASRRAGKPALLAQPGVGN